MWAIASSVALFSPCAPDPPSICGFLASSSPSHSAFDALISMFQVSLSLHVQEHLLAFFFFPRVPQSQWLSRSGHMHVSHSNCQRSFIDDIQHRYRPRPRSRANLHGAHHTAVATSHSPLVASASTNPVMNQHSSIPPSICIALFSFAIISTSVIFDTTVASLSQQHLMLVGA